MPAPECTVPQVYASASFSGSRSRREGRGVVSEAEFDAFARANLGRAVRMAWRLLGADHAAAEDVAQDALFAAYRALDGFRGDAKLDTWFFRILVRKAHNHRRWRALRLPFDGDAANDVPDPCPLDGAADAEAGRRIEAALEALSMPQRSAFVLVHLEGFTASEAAALMGKAQGTIKSHLQRALRKLRVELADLAPAGTAPPSRDTTPGEEEPSS